MTFQTDSYHGDEDLVEPRDIDQDDWIMENFILVESVMRDEIGHYLETLSTTDYMEFILDAGQGALNAQLKKRVSDKLESLYDERED